MFAVYSTTHTSKIFLQLYIYIFFSNGFRKEWPLEKMRKLVKFTRFYTGVALMNKNAEIHRENKKY